MKMVEKAIEGVRNICVAKIDSSQAHGFQKPIQVPGLGELKVTKSYKEGTLIGDMITQLQKKMLKQLDISVTVDDLHPESEALLQGMKYQKGVLITGKDDNQNPVALLWEEVYSDGSSKFCVAYNVKLARDEKGGNGDSDNIDYQTIALSGAGLYSDITKAFMGEFFSDDPEVDKDKIKYFFDAVQYPYETDAAIIPENIEEDGEDIPSKPTTTEVKYTATGRVDNISVPGITYDSSNDKFINVPSETTTFTFDDDGTNMTANKSDETWKVEATV
jgi:phi13 family phage major tail protein